MLKIYYLCHICTRYESGCPDLWTHLEFKDSTMRHHYHSVTFELIYCESVTDELIECVCLYGSTEQMV